MIAVRSFQWECPQQQDEQEQSHANGLVFIHHVRLDSPGKMHWK